MSRKGKKESTLNPILAGSVIDARVVAKVRGAPKSRKTRDVEFDDGTAKRVNVQLLQDRLLLVKGYQPKYSGRDSEWFRKRDNPKK